MSTSAVRPSRLSRRLRLLAAVALIGSGLGLPVLPGAPSAMAAPPPTPTDISGTVFQDTRPNGVRDLSAPTEAGVQGVTVTAYAASGAVAGTATSGSTGDYSITPTGSGPWRVEFSNLPQDYVFGRQLASDNGTSVRFVSALSSGNDLPVNLLGDYCQANPDYVTSCFTLGPTSLAPGSRQAVFSIPSTAKGYENTGGKFWTPPTSQALFTQVGAIYGMGYQASSHQWFGAAYLRRYTGFGPGGISAIYSTGGGTFIKLSDYGIDVGTDPHVLSAGLAINNHDAPSFALVGKIGLGDLDVSVDGTRLYTVNMKLKQLISIPITRAGALNTSSTSAVAAVDTVPGPQEIGVFTIPDAGCGANWRPMGIGMRGTSVFVGGTCSDQNVTIHKLNPTTGSWTQSVATFNVGFTRQGGETFQAWTDNEGSISNNAQIVRSQAMLADIAFDGQDLVLGLRDRFGDQSGYNTLTTNTADNTTRYRGQTAGDTLRACWNGGSWTLENNASCGTRTSNPGVGNNDGPGGGEYYYQDHIQLINYDSAGNETVVGEPGWHRNMSEGGLATSTFSGQVATTFMDPNDCWAQGVVWFDNGTGSRTQSWQFDRTANCNHGDGVNSPEGFGKANAMGDIEALCDEAPFEIGNRVWSDENRDGRQDANEPGIPGVTVQLFDTDGTTKLAEVVTDAQGNYVFSNAAGSDRGDAKYGIAGLKPGTTGYSVRVPSAQTALTQFTTTTANASAATGDGTATDSDSNGTAVGGNGATAAVDTGIAGTNDHTIDFGFYPRYELGNRV